MDAMDALYLHPELMTAEEREDFEHEPTEYGLRWFRDWILQRRPLAEIEERSEFLHRSPAVGLSKQKISQLRCYALAETEPGERRRLFYSVRDAMLRDMIPCSGLATTEALCDC